VTTDTFRPRASLRAAPTTTAAATPVPLALYQGDDYRITVTLADADAAPIDPALWTWMAQIRETTADADAGGPPVCQFTATITGMTLELVLDHADSELLTDRTYHWDLQGTEVATGWITTYLAGPVTVTQEVTR
jgi:hypothetical protein